MANFLRWEALTRAINQIPAVETFFLDRIFTGVSQEYAESLAIELIQGDRRLAPFVSDVEAGVIVDKTRAEKRTVTLPRMRPKKRFSAPELLQQRFPGQQGPFASPEVISAARNQRIALELQDLKNICVRTEEWMAVQACLGSLSVDAENINFAIDFRIPGDNKPSLTGKDKWNYHESDLTGDPLADMEDWCAIVSKATGYRPDTIIGPTAPIRSLITHPKVKELLNLRNYDVGALSRGAATFKGNLAGVNIYEYNNTYVDKDGTSHDMIPSTQVILLPMNSPHFIRHYGQIMDLGEEQGDALMAPVAMPFFAKSFKESDPSALWFLAESRPLPVPHWPEQIIVATVL